MIKNKPTILSTFLLEAPIMQWAANEGIDITAANFITIEPIITIENTQQIKQYFHQEILAIFTSQHAVNLVFNRELQTNLNWTFACVGQHTAAAIKAHLPHANIIHIANNSLQLGQFLVSKRASIPHVFFSGIKRRDEIPTLLQQHQIALEECQVYSSTNIEVPLSSYTFDAVLFASPSAVHSFFAQTKANTKTRYFVIGNTTADTLKTYTTQPVHISSSTCKEDVVTTAVQHFKNKI